MMRLWACINMLLRAVSQKRKSAQLSRSNTHTHTLTLSLSLSLCRRTCKPLEDGPHSVVK